MNGYSFMTRRPVVPVLPVLLVVILITLVFGISASAAESDDSTRAARPVVDPAAELAEDLASAESTINALERQLTLTKQTVRQKQSRIDAQRETIVDMRVTQTLVTQTLSASLATADTGFDQWTLGYELGGGVNHSAFEHIILPCESGGEPDPDGAIGPTDDWGRAQINRPTWAARFEELTGLGFEAHILDPVLNGYMAAVVEQEHASGLNAWTCWRHR